MKVITILLLLMVSAYAEDASNDRGSDAHIRQVLKDGLDDALREQVKHVFQVWLSTGGQATRARIGVLRAIDAYRRSIKAIDNADLNADITMFVDETFKVQSESSRPVKLVPLPRRRP